MRPMIKIEKLLHTIANGTNKTYEIEYSRRIRCCDTSMMRTSSRRKSSVTISKVCRFEIFHFASIIKYGWLAPYVSTVCVHNGTVYRSGSAMSTSSLCSYCYCIGGKQKCVKPKCLLPTEGCEPILIDTSCCPIRYDCSGNGTIKAQYRPKQHRRRSDNLHYLRMTSRMQRSRGMPQWISSSGKLINLIIMIN